MSHSVLSPIRLPILSLSYMESLTFGDSRFKFCLRDVGQGELHRWQFFKGPFSQTIARYDPPALLSSSRGQAL